MSGLRLHIEILEQESGQMRDVDIEPGEERVGIGRDRASQIVLNAPSVSRRHCRIVPQEDGWTLIDEGSTLGTIHNGNEIEPSQPVRLAHGDVILCASYELRIHIVPMTDPTLQPDPHALDRLLQAAGEERSAPARIWLFAGSEPTSRELTEEGTSLTVGRSSECDIQIADPFKVTSAVHAKIERNWAGVFLYDASINGVYVNGQRVQEEAKLQDGDRITIAIAEEDPDRPLLVYTAEGSIETPGSHGMGARPAAGTPADPVPAAGAGLPAQPATGVGGASSAAPASGSPDEIPMFEPDSVDPSALEPEPAFEPGERSFPTDSMIERARAAKGGKPNLLLILVLLVCVLALATVLVWGVLLLRG